MSFEKEQFYATYQNKAFAKYFVTFIVGLVFSFFFFTINDNANMNFLFFKWVQTVSASVVVTK